MPWTSCIHQPICGRQTPQIVAENALTVNDHAVDFRRIQRGYFSLFEGLILNETHESAIRLGASQSNQWNPSTPLVNPKHAH
jgi:hypothetical protein